MYTAKLILPATKEANSRTSIGVMPKYCKERIKDYLQLFFSTVCRDLHVVSARKYPASFWVEVEQIINLSD